MVANLFFTNILFWLLFSLSPLFLDTMIFAQMISIISKLLLRACAFKMFKNFEQWFVDSFEIERWKRIEGREREKEKRKG